MINFKHNITHIFTFRINKRGKYSNRYYILWTLDKSNFCLFKCQKTIIIFCGKVVKTWSTVCFSKYSDVWTQIEQCEHTLYDCNIMDGYYFKNEANAAKCWVLLFVRLGVDKTSQLPSDMHTYLMVKLTNSKINNIIVFRIKLCPMWIPTMPFIMYKTYLKFFPSFLFSNFSAKNIQHEMFWNQNFILSILKKYLGLEINVDWYNYHKIFAIIHHMNKVCNKVGSCRVPSRVCNRQHRKENIFFYLFCVNTFAFN